MKILNLMQNCKQYTFDVLNSAETFGKKRKKTKKCWRLKKSKYLYHIYIYKQRFFSFQFECCLRIYWFRSNLKVLFVSHTINIWNRKYPITKTRKKLMWLSFVCREEKIDWTETVELFSCEIFSFTFPGILFGAA